MFRGYLRKDGRKGVRNYLLVAYTVECAHHVAKEVQYPFRDRGVQVIGFHGCAPNDYANEMMTALCTHPNVGAVLIISLGCENLDKEGLRAAIAKSGRAVDTLTIQQHGGTKKTIDQGRQWVEAQVKGLETSPTVEMEWSELIVGTICGGSDATSGLTANPVIGKVFDNIIQKGATGIFEETGELIGCEHIMASRAATSVLKKKLVEVVDKAKDYYTKMGFGSFSDGNAKGGLSTIEEKSMGAYSKSGDSLIKGIIKPTIRPNSPGLYLLDVVPDGDPKFGWPNVNDNAEIVELISCGSHLILFSTGRGSVVGSAVAPVVKICANPETYNTMSDDMDIDAGKILKGNHTIGDVAQEVEKMLVDLGNGHKTKSEELLHQEFQLSYKQFNQLEPGCLPG